MKINKQSTTYIIIYIAAIVVVVGAALAITSMSLKDKQQENIDADKMKQILASVHITTDAETVADEFAKYITEQHVVDIDGNVITDNAFEVNVALESKKKNPADRQLPIYVCDLGEQGKKYILPAYGTGLWGPIWGYIAVDEDGSTIYGAYFSHQGETPGLGARIEEPAFSSQFNDKHMFVNDTTFIPVTVVKKGQKPNNGGEYVNAVSGGTITSKGVASMLDNCLTPYAAYLRKISHRQTTVNN